MSRAAVRMSLTGMDIDTEPPGPPAKTQSHVVVPATLRLGPVIKEKLARIKKCKNPEQLLLREEIVPTGLSTSTFQLPLLEPVLEQFLPLDESVERLLAPWVKWTPPGCQVSESLAQDIGTRLWPIHTVGDGDCLLHALSLCLWGDQDRTEVLRKVVGEVFSDKPSAGRLYRVWRDGQQRADKEATRRLQFHIDLDEHQYQAEFSRLVEAATSRTAYLSGFHVYVLANALRRPIVVFADRILRLPNGEQLAPCDMSGVYIPTMLPASFCFNQPLAIGYTCPDPSKTGHFTALVGKRGALKHLPLVDERGQALPVRFGVRPASPENPDPAGQKISEYMDTVEFSAPFDLFVYSLTSLRLSKKTAAQDLLVFKADAGVSGRISFFSGASYRMAKVRNLRMSPEADEMFREMTQTAVSTFEQLSRLQEAEIQQEVPDSSVEKSGTTPGSIADGIRCGTSAVNGTRGTESASLATHTLSQGHEAVTSNGSADGSSGKSASQDSPSTEAADGAKSAGVGLEAVEDTNSCLPPAPVSGRSRGAQVDAVDGARKAVVESKGKTITGDASGAPRRGSRLRRRRSQLNLKAATSLFSQEADAVNELQPGVSDEGGTPSRSMGEGEDSTSCSAPRGRREAESTVDAKTSMAGETSGGRAKMKEATRSRKGFFGGRGFGVFASVGSWGRRQFSTDSVSSLNRVEIGEGQGAAPAGEGEPQAPDNRPEEKETRGADEPDTGAAGSATDSGASVQMDDSRGASSPPLDADPSVPEVRSSAEASEACPCRDEGGGSEEGGVDEESSLDPNEAPGDVDAGRSASTDGVEDGGEGGARGLTLVLGEQELERSGDDACMGTYGAQSSSGSKRKAEIPSPPDLRKSPCARRFEYTDEEVASHLMEDKAGETAIAKVSGGPDSTLPTSVEELVESCVPDSTLPSGPKGGGVGGGDVDSSDSRGGETLGFESERDACSSRSGARASASLDVAGAARAQDSGVNSASTSENDREGGAGSIGMGGSRQEGLSRLASRMSSLRKGFQAPASRAGARPRSPLSRRHIGSDDLRGHKGGTHAISKRVPGTTSSRLDEWGWDPHAVGTRHSETGGGGQSGSRRSETQVDRRGSGGDGGSGGGAPYTTMLSPRYLPLKGLDRASLGSRNGDGPTRRLSGEREVGVLPPGGLRGYSSREALEPKEAFDYREAVASRRVIGYPNGHAKCRSWGGGEFGAGFAGRAGSGVVAAARIHDAESGSMPAAHWDADFFGTTPTGFSSSSGCGMDYDRPSLAGLRRARGAPV